MIWKVPVCKHILWWWSWCCFFFMPVTDCISLDLNACLSCSLSWVIFCGDMRVFLLFSLLFANEEIWSRFPVRDLLSIYQSTSKVNAIRGNICIVFIRIGVKMKCKHLAFYHIYLVYFTFWCLLKSYRYYMTQYITSNYGVFSLNAPSEWHLSWRLRNGFIYPTSASVTR